MATLPRARVLQALQGAGVGNGSDLLCIMSVVSAGATYTPTLYTKVQDALDVHGYHEGLEAAAMHVEANGLPFLHIGLDVAEAAAIGPVNRAGMTGTSVPSFSGTPLDDEDLVVKVVDGGIVGVTGVTVQCSRDGGRVFGKKIRLGTATSIAIPRTGVTVAFGTGTLVAGDIVTARCTSPKPDGAGFLAAYNALAATGHLPRLILHCGDVDTISKAQDICDRISAYETTNQRHARAIFSARQRYADCAMQKTRGVFKRDGVAPTDIDFDASLDTITRNTGSWITDGFAVGQSVVVSGAAQAGNNQTLGVISVVTATVLTLPSAPGLTAESNTPGSQLTIIGYGPGDVDFAASTITRNIGSFIDDGFKVGMTIKVTGSASNNLTAVLTAVSATVLTHNGAGAIEANVSAAALNITGTETEATWRAAVNLIVGATPSTEVIQHRAAIRAGRGRKQSPIDGTRRRRPQAWAEAIRIMGHDLHVSPAKMDNGAVDGWTIHDEKGILEDHDERVNGGLNPIRVGCFTSSDDLKGTFISNGLTLDDDNAPLSRIQTGFVCDLACRIAKRETTRRLNSEVRVSKTTGFIFEADAKAIEESVTTVLKGALLTAGAEGARASDVSFTMARNVDLRVPGAETPCEVVVTTLGYLEQISTTVRVAQGS